jgi:hypothetical protein
LSTTGKPFENIALEIVQKHIAERGLLKVLQLRFRARHSATVQNIRRSDHLALNVNNNVSTADVFLNIEKAFDAT